MLLEHDISLKWNNNLLVNSKHQNNKNIKIINKLQENLSIITDHNITLLELKSSSASKIN